jgi:membrane-bound lytic murein transglycosylase B
MRNLLKIGALLTVFANPAHVYTSVAYAAEPAPVNPVVKLNLESHSLIQLANPKPDFTVDFVIPARKAQAEREEAKLKNRIDQLTAKLAAAGRKTEFAADYVRAEAKTGTPAELTAAVHIIESGQSGDRLVTSSAGAQGPMQFIPSTWARWAQDADGDGIRNINGVHDAILTGATYLQAGGAAAGNYQNALFSYNHAQWYVNQVLGIAQGLGLK